MYGSFQIVTGRRIHRQDLTAVRIHDDRRRQITSNARLPLIQIFLDNLLDVDVDRQLQRLSVLRRFYRSLDVRIAFK